MSKGMTEIDAELSLKKRKEAGLSERELAAKAGISRSAVRNAEDGKQVTFRTAKCMSDALGVDLTRRIIREEGGNAIIDSDSPQLDVDPTKSRFTTLKIVVEHLNKSNSEDVVHEFLDQIMILAQAREIEIRSMREGSLHFEVAIDHFAAEKLAHLFERNESGELVIDKATMEVELMIMKDYVALHEFARERTSEPYVSIAIAHACENARRAARQGESVSSAELYAYVQGYAQGNAEARKDWSSPEVGIRLNLEFPGSEDVSEDVLFTENEYREHAPEQTEFERLIKRIRKPRDIFTD